MLMKRSIHSEMTILSILVQLSNSHLVTNLGWFRGFRVQPILGVPDHRHRWCDGHGRCLMHHSACSSSSDALKDWFFIQKYRCWSFVFFTIFHTAQMQCETIANWIFYCNHPKVCQVDGKGASSKNLAVKCSTFEGVGMSTNTNVTQI